MCIKRAYSTLSWSYYILCTSVILKGDISDQRYENVTQVLDVRPPKPTSKTPALRRLYKKNASKCARNQPFFLALCAEELETYLYPRTMKEKHRG